MASGGNPAPDDSEDDGDLPIQEHQPECVGTTLTLALLTASGDVPVLRGGLRDRLKSRGVDVAPPVAAAASRGGAWRADNPDGLPLHHLRRCAGETADNPRLLGEPPSFCPPPPSPAPVPDMLELLHVKEGALQP
ncbi:hypothetical protein HPB51_018232 [Rhipicephalus microplus]|uniref:Uncharacterized protein n=1 Tax=Rhipicephalus microplus TaxID=6941 RepID=A0A9J6E327_RHIMP|nr:hypothetical protein HPB51_018232 [Rhipicephalus microplus]